MRVINPTGLAIVKEAEGFRAKAYLCPAKVWTIGYGHTKGVREGDTCTPTQAEQWLGEDMHDAEKSVAALVKVPLTDNQFSALVSFTFNLGAGALKGSTLLKQLNEGAHERVPDYLKAWVFAGGKRLKGLETRRAAEANLWSMK